MPEERKVRLSLELSHEMNEELEGMTRQASATKADVLRKAIVLMRLAMDAKARGRKVGIAAPGQELATEFVGF